MGTPAGYLDGAERFLLDALDDVADRSTGSNELQALMRDWPTRYHLTPYRVTIFDSLGFTGARDASVLELGSGCGAITRWLGEHFSEVHAVEGNAARAQVARTRCADLEGVEVYAANYSELVERDRFDVATLIGVLEYGHLYHPEHGGDPEAAALANLRVAYRALKENGVLVLAIENRLGLKYLNGAREDHSGRLFEGIQGYPDTATPVTFSARALRSLLAEAGFTDADFLLPFPDYKLASTIINPDRCEPEHAIHNWVGAPAPDRGSQRVGTLFNESLATRELARAGLITDLANSFLVVAYAGGREPAAERLGLELDWAARHYSLDRAAALRKRVTLAGDIAEHAACDFGRDPERDQRIEASLATAFGLRQTLRREALSPGDLLIFEVFESFAADGAGERFRDQLRTFRRWLIDAFGHGDGDAAVPLVKGSALDATWWNVVVHPTTGEWQVIDREWELAEPVPADFVLWRMLAHFLLRHRVQLPGPVREADPPALVQEWLEAAGAAVSPQVIERFAELDRALSSGISAGRAPDGPAPELAAVHALSDAPRSFSVLAFADEVAEEPSLLRAWADLFTSVDAATLVLYAPDAEAADAAAEIERALGSAGLADDGGPDMMLVATAANRLTEVTLARSNAALLSEREPDSVFCALPRYGLDRAGALRELAEALWAA